MHRDPVVGPQSARVDAQLLLQVCLERERERGVDPAAERSVQAYAPVADLVAESLHHDGAVVRHDTCGSRLVVEVGQQVLDGEVVEARAFPQPLRGSAGVDSAQLAHHLAQRRAELDRTARRVRLPEGDLARLARRGGDEHLRRRDLGDPPRRCAEHERLADASLVDHLLVELADAAPVLEQVDRVETAIGDRARVGDREPLRARPPTHLAADAIPYDARPKLDELVGRIAPAQHVEHRLEGARPEVAVRICAPDHPAEMVDVPLIERAHSDDLLGQDVERLPRHDRRLDAALEHALHDGGRLEQVAAELRDDDAA